MSVFDARIVRPSIYTPARRSCVVVFAVLMGLGGAFGAVILGVENLFDTIWTTPSYGAIGVSLKSATLA